ncbi:ABC transporter permease (plasmid) [Skermanella sp. TT6]|uniref:ABC transporter permease n=1 Tax=Skermanella cutis TaxID=2775420 RepID=A0ABX7BJV8_9PROT|nr:ABC transporter permease [Skermanella sp. TT6]QQP93529.1 ABC transporter permease [Skermanella sp. TT6]
MTTWLSNVFRLGLKELASLAGDKVLFAFILYSFSFSVYSVATGVKTEIENASVAVVDGDHSALSSRLREAFLQPYFRPPALIDRAELDPAMDRGEWTFVLDIPPRFEADALRGLRPELQLNIDATAMTQAGVGAGYIEAIVQREAIDFLRARGDAAAVPIDAVTRAWFNPNLEGAWFHSVMAVMENITILSILLVGAAVIREREHGTIEHLLVMPVRASEIAVAKIWANGLVILVAAGLSLRFVVQGALGVPVEGSMALFLVGAAAYLFATTSLGILLATLVRSMPQFALMAIPVFLILNMLSGATSPIEGMPPVLETLIQASPTVHFVTLSQAVLFRAAGLEVVWPQLLILAGLGALFLAAALARFRTMLAQAHQ